MKFTEENRKGILEYVDTETLRACLKKRGSKPKKNMSREQLVDALIQADLVESGDR